MSDTNTKHGMNWASRQMSWKACWCCYCQPRKNKGSWRRIFHKAARRQAKREIREQLD